MQIPRQTYLTKSAKYQFIFLLSDELNVPILMSFGSSIFPSVQFLIHRQLRPHQRVVGDDVFFNLALYGNQRLFRRIKKLFDGLKHDLNVSIHHHEPCQN